MSSHPTYNEGDKVTIRTSEGFRRTITVEYKTADIKGGRPGFDGVNQFGEPTWGYDDQIERVTPAR